jgi:hypothetical protein
MKPDELLEAVRLHLHERLGALDSRHTAMAQEIHAAVEEHVDEFVRLRDEIEGLGRQAAALAEVQGEASAALVPLTEDIKRLQANYLNLRQQADDTQEMVVDADLCGLVSRVQQLDEAVGIARAAREVLSQRLEEVHEDLKAHQGDLGEEQGALAERLTAAMSDLADSLDTRLGQIQARVDQILVEHADVWDAALTSLEAAHKAQVREVEGRLTEHLDGLGATVERLAEARVQNADATDRALAEQALEITAAQVALQTLEISTGEQVREVEGRLTERLDGLGAALERTSEARVQNADATNQVLAVHSKALAAVKVDFQALETSTGAQVRRVEDGLEVCVAGWETDLQAARDEASQQVAEVARLQATRWEKIGAQLQEQGRATEERLAAYDQALEVQQEALEALVESKAVELHLRVEEASLQRAEALRETLQDELETLSTRRDENLQDALDDGLQRIRGDLLQRYTQAEAWARGGEDYKPLAIVRHHGGLWQATARTSAEPDSGSPDWMLLVEGVHEIGYEIDEGQAWTTIRLSSGLVQRAPVPYPAFRARGTYRAGEAYRQWDVVVRNRTTFMAAQDTDSEPSNRNGHWIQLSDVVQGPKGPAGKDGRSVGREDLIALLPQITRMLADEMERRQQEHEDAAARHAAEQVRL